MIGHRFGRLVVESIHDELPRRQPSHVRWNCKCDCGQTKVVIACNLKQGQTKSCGCLSKEIARKTIATLNSKKQKDCGGKIRTSNGYIYVWADENSPYGKSKIYEHHYVMSLALKRKLLSHETVHHKNGIRSDNRLENLELWSSSHPSGQRVVDKVRWAKEILELYGYE